MLTMINNHKNNKNNNHGNFIYLLLDDIYSYNYNDKPRFTGSLSMST